MSFRLAPTLQTTMFKFPPIFRKAPCMKPPLTLLLACGCSLLRPIGTVHHVKPPPPPPHSTPFPQRQDSTMHRHCETLFSPSTPPGCNVQRQDSTYASSTRATPALARCQAASPCLHGCFLACHRLQPQHSASACWLQHLPPVGLFCPLPAAGCRCGWCCLCGLQQRPAYALCFLTELSIGSGCQGLASDSATLKHVHLLVPVWNGVVKHGCSAHAAQTKATDGCTLAACNHLLF